MAAPVETFGQWLSQAQLDEATLTPTQHGLLQAAFQFRQRQGTDYYSTRMLSHLLLNCNSGLRVAQIARLLGVCRTTASRQKRLSSKETIQAAHHRLDGRPYGKLLPRYAGPIAQFLLTHADASRYDVLQFIDDTWHVRISTVALSKFLKKYGLDRRTLQAPLQTPGPTSPLPTVPATPVPPPIPLAVVTAPALAPAPPFSAHAPSTPGPSCCCPWPVTG